MALVVLEHLRDRRVDVARDALIGNLEPVCLDGSHHPQHNPHAESRKMKKGPGENRFEYRGDGEPERNLAEHWFRREHSSGRGPVGRGPRPPQPHEYG